MTDIATPGHLTFSAQLATGVDKPNFFVSAKRILVYTG